MPVRGMHAFPHTTKRIRFPTQIFLSATYVPVHRYLHLHFQLRERRMFILLLLLRLAIPDGFLIFDKRQWVTISECLQMLFKEVLQYHPTNNQPIDRICRWKSLALLCIPAPHFEWESGFAFKCIGEKSVVQLKNVIRRLTLMGTMEGRGYIGCLLQQN